MEVSCKITDCTQSGGRGLFATHYAKLADAHEGSSSVASRHMACEVSMMPSGREQVGLTLGGNLVSCSSGLCTHMRLLLKVTFLYKLADGCCPKSYGVACARFAGAHCTACLTTFQGRVLRVDVNMLLQHREVSVLSSADELTGRLTKVKESV